MFGQQRKDLIEKYEKLIDDKDRQLSALKEQNEHLVSIIHKNNETKKRRDKKPLRIAIYAMQRNRLYLVRANT